MQKCWQGFAWWETNILEGSWLIRLNTLLVAKTATEKDKLCLKHGQAEGKRLFTVQYSQ